MDETELETDEDEFELPIENEDFINLDRYELLRENTELRFRDVILNFPKRLFPILFKN